MRRAFLAATVAFVLASPVSAQGDPEFVANDAPVRAADTIDRLFDRRYRDDDGDWHVAEQGIFDTESQADWVIRRLAHVEIAYRVDCTCSGIRMDSPGVRDLELDVLDHLPGYGYIPRLLGNEEREALPERQVGDESGAGGWSGGTPATRGTDRSVFSDTRLADLVLADIRDLLAGRDFFDDATLCAAATESHDDGSVLSQVLIRNYWNGASGNDE